MKNTRVTALTAFGHEIIEPFRCVLRPWILFSYFVYLAIETSKYIHKRAQHTAVGSDGGVAKWSASVRVGNGLVSQHGSEM